MICLENYWSFERIKATELEYHCSNVLLFTLPPLGVQSIAMSLSVCLSIRIFQKRNVQTSRNFLGMLPWSCLSVLWRQCNIYFQSSGRCHICA